jgi:hypothetical protein
VVFESYSLVLRIFGCEVLLLFKFTCFKVVDDAVLKLKGYVYSKIGISAVLAETLVKELALWCCN